MCGSRFKPQISDLGLSQNPDLGIRRLGQAKEDRPGQELDIVTDALTRSHAFRKPMSEQRRIDIETFGGAGAARHNHNPYGPGRL